MVSRVNVGLRLLADHDVIVGYASGRPGDEPLALGPDARLRSGTVLYQGSAIGARFETGHHVVIREGCKIGDDVTVWSSSIIDYGCRIGSGVKIHANCYVAQFTEIEDAAFLAPGVSIANDLYPGNASSKGAMSGPSIGAGAQIGVNVTILPFVRIGAGALVGAGSTVTRDVSEGCVAYGSPAVVHGSVQDLERIERRVEAAPGSVAPFRLARKTS